MKACLDVAKPGESKHAFAVVPMVSGLGCQPRKHGTHPPTPESAHAPNRPWYPTAGRRRRIEQPDGRRGAVVLSAGALFREHHPRPHHRRQTAGDRTGPHVPGRPGTPRRRRPAAARLPDSPGTRPGRAGHRRGQEGVAVGRRDESRLRPCRRRPPLRRTRRRLRQRPHRRAVLPGQPRRPRSRAEGRRFADIAERLYSGSHSAPGKPRAAGRTPCCSSPRRWTTRRCPG